MMGAARWTNFLNMATRRSALFGVEVRKAVSWISDPWSDIKSGGSSTLES